MDLKTYLALEAKADKQCPDAWEAMSLQRSNARDDGNENDALVYLQSALCSGAYSDKAEKWLKANGITF